MELSSEQKTQMLSIVRIHLEHRLLGGEKIQIPQDSLYEDKYGIFVTLHIKGNLRGCIGHIIAFKPLKTSIIEMTESAAFHDPRFPALTLDELDIVDIEISILSKLQVIENWRDIELGKHGILLKYGPYQSVYLPQVAPEQKWDLETTLGNLALKAGLAWDDYQKKEIEYQVFTALVFSE